MSTRPEDLRPAAVVFCAGTAAILAGDVWLMVGGRQPVTAWLRTPAGRGFLTLLGLHVADVLGPADPFRAVAWAAGVVKGRRNVTGLTARCHIP